MKVKNHTSFEKLLRAILIVLLVITVPKLYAQQIDLEHVGKNVKSKIQTKKPFKISGGVNASTIFYTGNAGSGRDPFTYLFNGNVNLSLYGINVPVSFSFTNSGFSYKYSYPRLPNRLSIHPKYKWVTGHIGDVAMSFSPYTLSGVLFTGVGADLAPPGKWKYSVMYGRLQKAVEYRPNNGNTLATYKRKGYGAKAMYDNGPYKWGVSIFRAGDDLNSLQLKPDSLQIYPQENTAISMEGSIPVVKNLVFTSEYAISALTRDVRAPKGTDSTTVTGLAKILGGRTSTNIYKAAKADLKYVIGSAMIGVGYERVDPGYQTLGAYYFTNDLENITANFAQSLFKGKVNLSGNIGLQRDDLDKKKSGGSRRTVTSFNMNYTPNKRFTSSATYSNFTTFTNVKPQFQYINQLTPFDNLDTLNFRQLSQNANLNINYILSENKEKPQNLNMNFSFQDSYDMQGGVITNANASQFYNFAGSYSRTNVKRAMSINGAFNMTYNTIGTTENITLGPTLSVNKQLWDKKGRTSASLSYNTTSSAGVQLSTVFSFRMNGGYIYKKKHNMNLSVVGMNRKTAARGSTYDYTATVAYSYNF
jgi:hypothetical protein